MNELVPVDLRAETPTFSNPSTMNDEDLFAQLEHPCEIQRSARPKIQRVAHHLRSRKAFAEYYSPRMVSLGPIHHGEPHLKLGEQYKLLWASMYVERDRDRARYLHRRVERNIGELKNLYSEEAIGDKFNDQQLARMLFVDGCSVLQMLRHPDILKPQALEAKIDQMALVRQDALLLENQLPFRLLQLLSDLPDDQRLINQMHKFLLCTHFSGEKPQNNGGKQGNVTIDVDPCSPLNPPAHLLDELRKKVLRKFCPDDEQKGNKKRQITHRNLKELKAAGIRVKRKDSECPIDITFSSSWFGTVLRLPDVIVDDTTAPTYLNLMAYEACPDFENEYEISSYVEFLDSLIDHADDVKELRRAQVLHNSLGSDEMVAELFNVISTDVVPNEAIYGSLRGKIEKRYHQKLKTWLSEAYNAHFRNPWSFIAFIAACVILLLAAFQTWFAVFPRH